MVRLTFHGHSCWEIGGDEHRVSIAHHGSTGPGGGALGSPAAVALTIEGGLA